MSRKLKLTVAIAAFALLIASAVFIYNALRGSVSPEIVLTEQPGSVSAPQDNSSPPDNSTAAEPESIKAPDFTAEDVDGNAVKLSEMAGKPVVLNFWASWCPPCKLEMPEFDKVYMELGSEVTFMMVNLTDGQQETKEKGSAYIAEQGYSFPVYYDTEQEAAYSYGIRAIPTTLFIDSEGYIITGAEGQLDEKTLRSAIDLILVENNGDSQGLQQGSD